MELRFSTLKRIFAYTLSCRLSIVLTCAWWNARILPSISESFLAPVMAVGILSSRLINKIFVYMNS